MILSPIVGRKVATFYLIDNVEISLRSQVLARKSALMGTRAISKRIVVNRYIYIRLAVRIYLRRIEVSTTERRDAYADVYG